MEICEVEISVEEKGKWKQAEKLDGEKKKRYIFHADNVTIGVFHHGDWIHITVCGARSVKKA